jgi:4-hydroxy-tetrahydrodipicolinate synthase
VLTPQDPHLDVAYSRLVSHINWLLQRGNNGIGILGTTGEANSFSVDERMRILEAVLDAGIPADKLLVGTGCYCDYRYCNSYPPRSVAPGRWNSFIASIFITKILVIAGLESYFAELLDRVGENKIEIYLYHFPQLTGVPFMLSFIERLVSKYPDQIVGMKDSGGDWSHMEEIMRELPGFRLYTGNEKFLLPTLKAGGSGCISASANYTSPEVALVYEAWKMVVERKNKPGPLCCVKSWKCIRLSEPLNTFSRNFQGEKGLAQHTTA